VAVSFFLIRDSGHSETRSPFRQRTADGPSTVRLFVGAMIIRVAIPARYDRAYWLMRRTQDQLMDQRSLQRLTDGGIATYPPAQLGHLAEWCWDFGEATGDARYCSLSRTVWVLADLWKHHDGVATSLVADLDALPGIRLAVTQPRGGWPRA
jgi:hypothetical protein